MSKGAQIAIGASAILLLLGWYALTNLESDSTFQYYQTLEEFQAASAGLDGRSLRVHGYVAEDSIQRDLAAKRVRFAVQNDPPHAAGRASNTLPVVFLGLETPDLFKDGAEVVIEGRMDGAGNEAVFVAENVMAKCPSKFQAKAELAEPRETEL
jgi:cytochrome c-type biogenesis protein CcmE